MARIQLRNQTPDPMYVALKKHWIGRTDWQLVEAGEETDFGRHTGWHNGWVVWIGTRRSVRKYWVTKLHRDSIVTLRPGGRGGPKISVGRPPNMGTATIDHVVVLMLENRSFDNILGWMYDGQDTTTLNYIPERKPRTPLFMGLEEDEYWNEDSAGNRVYATKGTTDGVTSRWVVPDPDPREQFRFMNQQQFCTINPKSGQKPSMKGFLVDYEGIKKNPAPEKIMESYAPDQVPVLTALARQYAVCDRWFASAPCQTWPNRSFVHAGTSNGRINNLDGPTDTDKLPSPKYYDIPTVYEFLENVGVPWSIYSGFFSLTLFQFKKRLQKIKSLPSRVLFFFRFKLQARWGTLPAYSFIEPTRWLISTNDQHPPFDVRPAEKLIHDVYSAVSKGKHWKNTLLIITYDEHGGCYDHVPPPATAVKPDDAKPQVPPVEGVDPFDFERYGVRVPTVVISPHIQAGTVFRSGTREVEYDHTSILATLRDWIDPTAFNKTLGSRRIKAAPTLGQVLTLDKARTRLPRIPDPVTKGYVRPSPDTKLNPIQLAALATVLPKVPGVSAAEIRTDEISTIGDARRALRVRGDRLKL